MSKDSTSGSSLLTAWTSTLVASMAVGVLLFRLGHHSLVDYDEGIYACLASNILRSGDWMTLVSYRALEWLDKPPLAMWLMASSMKVFGTGEFWVRAPSAIAGVILVFVTYQTATRLYGSRVALIAPLHLLTTFEFLFQARRGQTDVILTLFICLGLYAYVRIRQQGSTRWWWFFWASFGLGFMTKSMGVAVLPISIALAALIERQLLTTLRCRDFWIGVTIACALILPWHVAMIRLHGQEFIDRYFLYDIVARTSGGLMGNTGSATYYYERLADRYFPWHMLAPFAVAFGIRDYIVGRSRTVAPVSLVAVVFLLYSFVVQTKIPQYLTPMFPALAIVTAGAFADAFRSSRSFTLFGIIYASTLAAIFGPSKPVAALVVLLSLGLAAIFVVARRSRMTSHGSGVTAMLDRAGGDLWRVGLVAALCLFLAGLGANRSRPLYHGTRSPVEQISRAAAISPGQLPLLSLALEKDWSIGIVGPAASFYSGRTLHVAWSLGELEELAGHRPPREILLARTFMEELSGDYEFAIIEEVPPFVYATIRQREAPQGSFDR